MGRRHARKDLLLKFPFADEDGSVKSILESQRLIDPLVETSRRRRRDSDELWRHGQQHRQKQTQTQTQRGQLAEEVKRTSGGADGRRKPWRAVGPGKPVELGPVQRQRQLRQQAAPEAEEEQASVMQIVDRLCEDPVVLAFLPEEELEAPPPNAVRCAFSQQQAPWQGREVGAAFANVWGAPEPGCVTPTSSQCEEELVQAKGARERLLEQLSSLDHDLCSSESENGESDYD